MSQGIAVDKEQAGPASVAGILNSLLADEYVLYTKTRNYHWNVTGPQFGALRKFFEAQYAALDGAIDEAAERVRALRERPYATLAEFLKHTELKEAPGVCPKASDMIAQLLYDHERVMGKIRVGQAICDECQDLGTRDFLTGLLRSHEKAAWMLRAHLEGK